MRSVLDRHRAVIDAQHWPKAEKAWLRREIRKHLNVSADIRADALTPQYRWNYCVERLKDGLFTSWDGFEFRSDWSVTFRGFNGFETRVQKWNGQPVKSLTVLGEQGLGDEILFLSALPELLIRLGTKAITLHCYPQLRPIVERSYRIRTEERKTLSNVTEGDALVALGDLFPFYRRDIKHFPRKVYLKPDPERVEHWGNWLKQYGDGNKIGLGWYSRHGSVDPALLMTDPNAVYFDLQYRKSDKSIRPSPEGVICQPFDVANDFENLFAFVKVLNSVNSVTQTLVHVAGAIGTPCNAVIPPKNGEVSFDLWYHACKVLGDSHAWPHLIYPSVTVYESLDELRRSRRP